LATLIAVSTAFLLAWGLARGRLDIGEVLRKMKPWNFALIIIGMFIFLNIFKTSDAAGLISSIPLPMLVLGVLSGFALGLATGRVILPASIILPIYLTARPITPFTFSLIYTSMFFGYVISPIHPCICVTIEYFRVSLRSFLKLSALPALIVFVTVLLISVVWG
jgi:hypothetical protein